VYSQALPNCKRRILDLVPAVIKPSMIVESKLELKVERLVVDWLNGLRLEDPAQDQPVIIQNGPRQATKYTQGPTSSSESPQRDGEGKLTLHLAFNSGRHCSPAETRLCTHLQDFGANAYFTDHTLLPILAEIGVPAEVSRPRASRRLGAL
jgi:hypothetical protein